MPDQNDLISICDLVRFEIVPAEFKNCNQADFHISTFSNHATVLFRVIETLSKSFELELFFIRRKIMESVILS